MRYYLEPISPESQVKEYGEDARRFEVDITQFLDESTGATYRGFVSTFIFARRNEPYFLLGLDCDSTEDMLQTTTELSFRNMGYMIIESSPFRFWVLSEFVGTGSQCISIMETIPGVDPRYVKCTEKRNDFFLRAFPKNGFKPRFRIWDGMRWIYAEFGGNTKFAGNVFRVGKYISHISPATIIS